VVPSALMASIVRNALRDFCILSVRFGLYASVTWILPAILSSVWSRVAGVVVLVGDGEFSDMVVV
jgi:hypothetical protein